MYGSSHVNLHSYTFTDQLPHSVGIIHSTFLPNDLSSVVLEWNTSSQMTCSRESDIDSYNYTIAIDGVPVPPDRITVLSSTLYLVSDLEPNRMYIASVGLDISSCASDLIQSRNVTFEIRAESEFNMPYYYSYRP